MTANVIPFPASQPQPARFVGALRLDPGDPDQGCGGGHMRRLRLPSDPHGWDSIVLVADLNRHGKQAVSVCFLAPQELRYNPKDACFHKMLPRVVTDEPKGGLIAVRSEAEAIESIHAELVTMRDYFAGCVEVLEAAMRGENS